VFCHGAKIIKDGLHPQRYVMHKVLYSELTVLLSSRDIIRMDAVIHMYVW
jgi:hypothetical protein